MGKHCIINRVPRTAMQFAGAVLAVAVTYVALPAHALTPLPACDKAERGMYVSGATNLGGYDSGLLLESYRNLNSADGVIGGADGPVPELNDFSGFRITDCKKGQSVAVHGDTTFVGAEKLLATEFLRTKSQDRSPLSLRQVRRAAEALYGKDGFTRVLRLRLTEEPCGCQVFYPEHWKK